VNVAHFSALFVGQQMRQRKEGQTAWASSSSSHSPSSDLQPTKAAGDRTEEEAEETAKQWRGRRRGTTKHHCDGDWICESSGLEYSKEQKRED
jgi:hypothetical protein